MNIVYHGGYAMASLFDLPADPLPPDPCPVCHEDRSLFAGAGQAFCPVHEWPQAEEAERVYRQTAEFRTRFPHFHAAGGTAKPDAK